MIDAALCPTNHDDDAPAAEDKFGVHARIATTIAQVIGQTAGGKTIGLSGTWGAGKSTVVRLLQNVYRDSGAATVVWTFDAWAHEGDPLRRTFLEGLIRTLSDKGWLAAGEWTDTLEFLARRRKVTERRTAPRLTPLGMLVAISVLLVPLGTALFSSRIRDGLVFDPSLAPDWLAIAGAALALAPLLALVARSIWVLVSQRGRRGWGSALLSALTEFVQRNDADSRTETLDSGDPTSLEFDAVFRGVMAAALGHDPQRRLIIVIDNLDRVGAAQALAVWSTLQTFLQRRDAGGVMDQLWCLIPFDAEAIRRLWQKDAPGTAVAESFLDKTFQLRFDVPLPRLANWKDYLLERLACALPAHKDSDEFFRIYRLSSVRRTADWMAPTPRQLKLFVNQIGSLHRQWGHDIPLADLAYYVLLQNEGVPIVGALLSGELPTPAEVGLVSDDVRLSLAALVYGSPVEQSHELLLRQPILDALEGGASERLTELAPVSDKFWLVLELAVEQGCQEWPQAEGGLVLHAAAALDGSGLFTAEPAWRVTALVRRLCMAVRATSGWAPMDARAVDGAIVLTRHDPALATLLHEGFTRARLAQVEKMTPTQAGEFARDYARLYIGLGAAPPSPLAVRDLPTYIEVARALATADNDARTWPHFVPEDAPAFVQGLCSLECSPGWGDVVRVAATAGVTAWEPLIEKASKGLPAYQGHTPAHELELLASVHALTSVGDTAAAKLLDDLTEAVTAPVDFERASERAFHRALAAVGEHTSTDAIVEPRDPDALGAWLYTMLIRQGTSTGLGRRRHSLTPAQEIARQWIDDQYERAAPRLVRILADAAIKLGDVAQLVKLAEREARDDRSWVDRTMVIQVLIALADLGAPPRILPSTLIVNEWNRAFPGWSCYDLARVMRSHRREISDTLASVPFQVKLASAYAGVLDASSSNDASLQSLCASQLASVPAEEWDASLRAGETGLPLLHAALMRRGLPIALSADVRTTLRAFVTSPPDNYWMATDVAAAITGAFDTTERPQVVAVVVDAFMAEAERLSTRDDYATHMFSGAARVQAAFAGRALLDPDRLAAQPQVFPMVVAFAIQDPADHWILWLLESMRARPALVHRLAADHRLALRKLVDLQSAARRSDDSRAALGALAAALAEEMPRAAADVQAV